MQKTGLEIPILSEIDGALLCDVKQELVPAGLLARLMHGAQADLLGAAEARTIGREEPEAYGVSVAGEWRRLPEL